MMTAHKYLFDRCFDTPSAPGLAVVECDAAAEPVERIEAAVPVTEDDLARARADALEEGRSQGLAEAASAIEKRIAGTLDSIDGCLDGLIAEAEDRRQQAIRAAIAVAAAIARKVMPAGDCDRLPRELERMIETVMDQLCDRPSLIVRVNDGVHEALAARLAEFARSRGFEDRLTVSADPAIAPPDCRIEWAGGGIERDTAALWQQIDALVERSLNAASSPPTADNHPASPGEPIADGAEFTLERNPEPQMGADDV